MSNMDGTMTEKIENDSVEKKVDILSANEIEKEVKPLSSNGFLAFWQRLWRGYLSWWYGFSDRHPKLSKLLYQILFFVLFSQGVTLFQLLIFMVLPHAFGLELAGAEWFFPGVKMYELNGKEYLFYFLGKPVLHDSAGNVIIGGGVGYFISFLIGTFLAQCINFPLQRNITFKSKGNPYYQAMWYFIGWILIQPFCDAIGSLWAPLKDMMAEAGVITFLITLIDTVIMGGVSMLIFFFVFLIIFPDLNVSEKRAQKKYDSLVAANADAEKIAAAQLKLIKAKEAARLYNARVSESKAITTASTKAVAFLAVINNANKAKTEEEKQQIEARIPEYQEKASIAIQAKVDAIAENKLAIEEVAAARAARGEAVEAK